MTSPEQGMLGVRPIHIADRLPTPEEVFKVSRLDAKSLLTKVLGPAAIPLGMAIGSGEWLMGPSVAATYGLMLFWMVWIGCVLQTIYNISWARLSVATGEPPIVLLNRIPPGPKFWGWFTPLNVFLRMFIPGWASAAATGLVAIMLGKIPGAAEAEFIRWVAVGLFLICILITLFGAKIESTLETVMKALIIFVLFSLIFIVAPLTVTGEALSEAARGFVSVGATVAGLDVLLIGGWWAYIGDAAAANFDGMNYYRDKGYGMGSIVGYIPAVIGGKKVALSPLGSIFKLTKENLEVFKRWERVVFMDQWGIFFVGAMFGMCLPALCVRSVVPLGTTLPAWGIAGHMANEFAAKVGPWGFYYICLIGFAILFSTQMGVVDRVVRNLVDCGWGVTKKISEWAKGDPRKFYYPVLVLYAIFGCAALWISFPLMLLLINANICHFIGIWVIPALIYIDRKIMPKELRAPIWMHINNIILMATHAFFLIAIIAYYGFGIKIF
ncbi:MAG: Nramp family divalent metal transporter [Candidatus Methanomethylicia archaeon]